MRFARLACVAEHKSGVRGVLFNQRRARRHGGFFEGLSATKLGQDCRMHRGRRSPAALLQTWAALPLWAPAPSRWKKDRQNAQSVPYWNRGDRDERHVHCDAAFPPPKRAPDGGLSTACTDSGGSKAGEEAAAKRYREHRVWRSWRPMAEAWTKKFIRMRCLPS
jgi:hypothetical protein